MWYLSYSLHTYQAVIFVQVPDYSPSAAAQVHVIGLEAHTEQTHKAILRSRTLKVMHKLIQKATLTDSCVFPCLFSLTRSHKICCEWAYTAPECVSLHSVAAVVWRASVSPWKQLVKYRKREEWVLVKWIFLAGFVQSHHVCVWRNQFLMLVYSSAARFSLLLSTEADVLPVTFLFLFSSILWDILRVFHFAW